MYSRVSVRPRMEPWGTPWFTVYSCQDFLSRATRNRLLQKKWPNKVNKTKIGFEYVKKTNVLFETLFN